MTFISYAQNYEDVMLWRALKHVEKGFYIDVGAAWPQKDSVTKAFYDKGWCGINIEPSPMHHLFLVNERSRDINLELAIGESFSQLTLNIVNNTGLSTLNPEISENLQNSNFSIEKKIVEVDTLASIYSKHVPHGQDVHFLKVDVEGFEEQVLKGNDWIKYRPWIVVIEATLPMTQVESHEIWEYILLEANYLLAYADGLNRFYIAKEHDNLAIKLKYPPNIFDQFMLIAQQQAEAKAKQAEAKAKQAEVTAHQNANQLYAVYSSRSWRITAPLRWLVRHWRLLWQHGAKARIKALIKKLLARVILLLYARPALKFFVIRIMSSLAMTDWLKNFVRINLPVQLPHFEKELGDIQGSYINTNFTNLSPRAIQIYDRLKEAIMQEKKGCE
jgi:FkbM family methyltransferase